LGLSPLGGAIGCSAAHNPPQRKQSPIQLNSHAVSSAGTAANQSNQSNKNKFNLFFFVDD